MTVNLRDMRPLVVHCDSDYIRAAFAVADIFPLPAVTLRACYAVPTAASGSYEEIQLADGEATPRPDPSPRTGWLAGEELANAQKQDGWESAFQLRWPFRNRQEGEDWEGREYVLSHLLNLCGVNIPVNSSPVLLIPPPTPTFPLSSQALYTQLAFEGLNTPMFSLLPAPLAGIYALGATTGIVIHIGHSESTVFVVTDSVVRWECSAVADVGIADCENLFERLLLEDDMLDKELKAATGKDVLDPEEKKKLVKEISNFVWNECTGEDIEVPAVNAGAAIIMAGTQPSEDEAFDVAKKLVGDTAPVPASHSHKSKKQQAQIQAAANKAAAAAAAEAAAQVDVIVINIPSLPEKEIQLGPVRHRICEPLLKGKSRGGDTVWEAVGRSLESPSLSLGERLSLWDGVCVIGEVAGIKSFPPALMTCLSPYLLSSADLNSDCQPSKMRLLSIPEYFSNYKKITMNFAPFLGGILVAKVAFTEASGKHSVSKVDYNAKGPEAIYAIMGEDR